MFNCIELDKGADNKGRSDYMKMTIVIGHAMIPTQTCCMYLYITIHMHSVHVPITYHYQLAHTKQ